MIDDVPHYSGKRRGACESGPLARQNHPLELFAARRVLVLTRGLFFRTQLGARNGPQIAARPSRESFPVMERSTRFGNRLLAALPPADFDLLAPHLREVSLERDAVLVRSGDPTEQIYFPRSGTIAFIMEMPNGQTVATAVVGNEGAVGMLTSLGPFRRLRSSV